MATPPVLECVQVSGRTLVDAETEQITDIAMLPAESGILPFGYGAKTTMAGVGAKASVWYTYDGGQNWTKCASALLFAVDQILLHVPSWT